MKLQKLGSPWLAGPRLVRAVLRRAATFFATMLHRATLGSLGANSRLHAGVTFTQPGRVHIGSDSLIWGGVTASADGAARGIEIGDRVQINRRVSLDMTGKLVIGADTLISEDSILYTHDHGLDPKSLPTARDKIIGERVWIGARVIVLPQCHAIGEGAVIGAGSVVTRDIPAGAIAAGAPARIVGWRPGFGPARQSEGTA
ncbi:acyltransferase [Pararhodobacter zhoushanensis]|uniref:acyltransferase n=1 Tax=Pararhodobacter zhoushanensis TaxID=2479545 RepID=UPI001C704622|nr:acyltransferase [Pararhodobacter zhoushanensis]